MPLGVAYKARYREITVPRTLRERVVNSTMAEPIRNLCTHNLSTQ